MNVKNAYKVIEKIYMNNRITKDTLASGVFINLLDMQDILNALASPIDECEAEFIIEDRKRIIKPLLELGQIKKQPLPPYEHLCQAIEETIKNAGVSND
jgi:hypothetical protein